MKKLSNITESIWTDMQKRSSGDDIRDEDAFNPDYIDFGENTTVYWMQDNLQIDGKVKFPFDDVKDYNNNGWRLPTKEEVEQLNWDGVKIQYTAFKLKYFVFSDGNKLEICTNGEGGTMMWTSEAVDEYPTAAWSYGLNNDRELTLRPFNKKNNKLFVFLVKDKNVSESIWTDMQKRSSGDDLRKEDDLTNIRELVPVEMGVTVLWADRDLEWKDGGFYFNYNEASNIIKNSKWRIPTKKESYELFQYTTMIKNTDEVCIQEGKFDDKPQLIFDKKGYKYEDGDAIFQKSMYAMWTSTEIKEIEAYYMSVIARMNDNHYTSMDHRNRLCVRLVQDRK